MFQNLDAASALLLDRFPHRFSPLQLAARSWLNRRTDDGPMRRVLLAYQNDSLAWSQFYPFLYFRERFRRAGYSFRAVSYDRLCAEDLEQDLTAIFIQAPYRPEDNEIENKLDLIARHAKHALTSFFDWFAPADLRFSERVAGAVNAYVKKSVLRDRAQYSEPTRGHTNLVDYYSERFNLSVEPPSWDVRQSILPQLVVGPSFATAPGLLGEFDAQHAPVQGGRTIDVHARIATGGTEWYEAMRSEALAVVSRSFPDLRVACTGRVTREEYFRELSASKTCFSPFGYGEICWRDFEAILSGAVLIKPDMSHLECEPDIYRAGETYVAVGWDLNDLEEKVRATLADAEGMRRMADNAYAAVRAHLHGPFFEDLLARLTH